MVSIYSHLSGKQRCKTSNSLVLFATSSKVAGIPLIFIWSIVSSLDREIVDDETVDCGLKQIFEMEVGGFRYEVYHKAVLACREHMSSLTVVGNLWLSISVLDDEHCVLSVQLSSTSLS
jgi:hypothetical protein